MMRRIYIHEDPDWPNMHWQEERIADRLTALKFQQGWLRGRMEALGFELRLDAHLDTLTDEAVRSSAIEGEALDTEQVRSSVARRLGMDAGGVDAVDRHVDGVVEMTLDATQGYDRPLTPDRLFGWQAGLFPAGRNRLGAIRVGDWRDDSRGPMQVVSGPIGRERVHFEAPAAERIDEEMSAFLGWFNSPASMDGVLRAGLAHLWFVTIHPFEDGNGRIARAVAEMALARSENSAQRFYSMSSQILRRRSAYYRILERTQRGDVDVTGWIAWFLDCLGEAIANSETALAAVLGKARFWEQNAGVSLNDRQRRVINRLLDGYDRKLTTTRWSGMTGCSQDTALRDITDLMERGILVRSTAGGRSTSYALADVRVAA